MTPQVAAVAPPRQLTVVHGHVLVAYTHQRDAGPGSYAYGVGLFVAPEGEAHTHVVWTVIRHPDGWIVENGSYGFEFAHAVAQYKARGGVVA